jgi:predicted transcriptional regulator
LVARGAFRSKAAAARAAIEAFVEAERRRREGLEIAEAYRLVPQTDEEVEAARSAAIRSIHEEPW